MKALGSGNDQGFGSNINIKKAGQVKIEIKIINMSGRGSNNKGKGQNAGKDSSQQKPAAKKQLSDFKYFLGSAKHAADYEITTAHLINHIRKTYDEGDDIAQSLEDLEYIDLDEFIPLQRKSYNPDKEEAAIENEGFKKLQDIRLANFDKHCETFRKNKPKAYGFLWDQCSDGLKQKIESRDDYKAIKKIPSNFSRPSKNTPSTMKIKSQSHLLSERRC